MNIAVNFAQIPRAPPAPRVDDPEPAYSGMSEKQPAADAAAEGAAGWRKRDRREIETAAGRRQWRPGTRSCARCRCPAPQGGQAPGPRRSRGDSLGRRIRLPAHGRRPEWPTGPDLGGVGRDFRGNSDHDETLKMHPSRVQRRPRAGGCMIRCALCAATTQRGAACGGALSKVENFKEILYDVGNPASHRCPVRHGNHDVHRQPLDADRARRRRRRAPPST
jgi:hypothetical protein